MIISRSSSSWLADCLSSSSRYPSIGHKDSDGGDEDMKELLNDARLLKRLKKGKINEEDFERGITGKLKQKSGPGELSDHSVDGDV